MSVLNLVFICFHFINLKKELSFKGFIKILGLKYFLPVFFLLFLNTIAQELPPIKNFYPEDYHGENQNWDISQATDKRVYVANSNGLLEFNGASWTLYPSPNETIMRSVKVVGDRVYTGSFMEFGYWKRNVFGRLEYTSISSKLSVSLIEDEEFWNIIGLENYMVFQSLSRIYIYNVQEGSVSTIASRSTINKTFLVDDTIYFHRLEEGLFKIESGKDQLISNADLLKKDEVINVFKEKEGILILTKDNGFFMVDKEGNLAPAEKFPNAMLKDFSLYDGIRLKDGNYALGTISDGLIHLKHNGDLSFQINQNNGLSNNTVLSVFEDLSSNIWLGLDYGVSYVNVKSPYRVYNDYNGKLGSVYAAAVFENKLYLGTNQGLYYKSLTSFREYELISGTQGQVWHLEAFHGELLCGHHKGTFQIKGNRALRVGSVAGTWRLASLDGAPNLLLQGNYRGLYVLEFDGVKWKLRNKIRGFNNSSRYFETLGNTIFVNHEYNGVFQLSVNDDFTKIEQVLKDTQIKGSNSGLVKYRGDVLYAYKEGILKFDTLQRKFFRDSLLSSVYSSVSYESGKLIVDKLESKLWIFTKPSIYFATPTGLTNDIQLRAVPLKKEMRDGILGYENIIKLDENKYLLGKTSGYTILDISENPPLEFSVNISGISNVQYRTDESLVDASKGGEFNSDQNDFHFSFYTPEYHKFSDAHYQFRLKGIYETWSEWSSQAEVTYENLPPGQYEFEVRSKIGDVLSSNTASYGFAIARPWYTSNVMLATYIIGVILFSLFMHNVYNKYYKRQREKLVEQNRKEMELAQVQSEKEIINLKNQQLQRENKAKTKELAASTMSIIKKNELLGAIKKELLNTVPNAKTIQPVVAIIDKSLDQNDNWEMFQEAFNNADNTFLKTVKSLHPSLSPNDLKLCAYLRLNLSSKEIAQLFNISPRSVEIKRYRLRKKLDLNHQDNLVNYILEL